MEPDFEELEQDWDPTKLSFIDHMIAGSFAGLAEHVAIFPLDTLKTNVQCEKCGSSSPMKTLNCAKRMVGQDGIFRLWRGVSAMYVGCIPAHAAYFSIFESIKHRLGADQHGHFPIQAAIAGACATGAHDLVMTPFDVVKQRLQLGYHQNIFDSARSIISLEGIGALFRSYPTTLVMNLPYGCIMVAANESLRKILNPDGKYSLKTSMIAGSLAGAVASTLTTPLDVVKTRLQTQDLTSRSVYSTPTTTNAASSPMTNRAMSGFSFYPRFLVSMVPDTCDAINTHPSSRTAPRYTSFFQTVQIIFKEEGAAAFFKGAFPRLLVQAPSVAISWTAYEFVKSCLVDSKKE